MARCYACDRDDDYDDHVVAEAEQLRTECRELAAWLETVASAVLAGRLNVERLRVEAEERAGRLRPAPDARGQASRYRQRMAMARAAAQRERRRAAQEAARQAFERAIGEGGGPDEGLAEAWRAVA